MMNAEKQKAGGNGQPTGAGNTSLRIIAELAGNATAEPLADDILRTVERVARQRMNTPQPKAAGLQDPPHQAAANDTANAQGRPKDIFELCRRLKGKAEMQNKPAQELRPVVIQWAERAGIDPSQHQQVFDEFCRIWANTRKPFNWAEVQRLILAGQFAKIKALCAFCPPESSQALHRLAYLCKRLGMWAEGGVFFLSCRQAGKIIGTSPERANALLRWLVRLGFLEIVKSHTHDQARRFRWKHNAEQE